jgi:hypothetical protein
LTTPGVTPVTIPVEPTVAIEVLPLIHPPPVVASARVMVEPTATVPAPVIAAGAAYTVNEVVTLLLPTVYVIVTVPADTPETAPPDVTVAIAVLLLLQVPPLVESVRME